MMFWITVAAAVTVTLALAWRKDRKRRANLAINDGFANASERQSLEKDPQHTTSGLFEGSASVAPTSNG